MVDVTDGADVAVRLVTLKFGLGHRLLSVSRLATDVLKSDPVRARLGVTSGNG